MAEITLNLSDKAKEARKRYNRKYYMNHKDQYKAARERYWEKQAEQLEQEDANV